MTRLRIAELFASLVLLTLALVGPATSQAPPPSPTPKAGGTLNLMLREDLPQGFAIHETATISTVWPAMPCLNNLVLFDPLKKTESVDTIIGELAEKWSWQDNYRNLVFFLRKGVKWHDGQPFTAKDVKFTFDMLREAPDAPAKLRINPRKDWYANVEAIEAPDSHTVVFRLKRPQPSFLMLLASGYTPVYAAHLSPASYRTGCVGTGPFKLKERRQGEYVELVRDPDYLVDGRPYLDTLKYFVLGDTRRREGEGEAAHGRGGRHAREAAPRRDRHARDRDLRGHGVVRDQRAQAGRHRGLAQADRDRAVAPDGDPWRLPDRSESHGHRAGRPGRELLRELRLRLAAQLQPVLQRRTHEDGRCAVAGARSEEAAGDGLRDPEEARGRGRPPHPGLEARLLHGVAAREEPDPAPVHLQLRADAGRVDGPVRARR